MWQHFGSSGKGEENGDAGLNALTEAVPLGKCDAFISHSWHDPTPQKWAALRSWAEDFESVAGAAFYGSVACQ